MPRRKTPETIFPALFSMRSAPEAAPAERGLREVYTRREPPQP
jgi:hypothetical protein